MDEARLAARLAAILAAHGATRCPACGTPIGWGALAWNNGSTESGTEYATVEIVCEACDTEIDHFHSWYPGIDSRDDLLYVLEKDWEDEPGE